MSKAGKGRDEPDFRPVSDMTLADMNRANADAHAPVKDCGDSADCALDAEREPDQSDIEAAQRGNRMNSLGLLDLQDLVNEHQGKNVFASKAIAIAAKQMIAAKKRAGAQP